MSTNVTSLDFNEYEYVIGSFANVEYNIGSSIDVRFKGPNCFLGDGYSISYRPNISDNELLMVLLNRISFDLPRNYRNLTTLFNEYRLTSFMDSRADLLKLVKRRQSKYPDTMTVFKQNMVSRTETGEIFLMFLAKYDSILILLVWIAKLMGDDAKNYKWNFDQCIAHIDDRKPGSFGHWVINSIREKTG